MKPPRKAQILLIYVILMIVFLWLQFQVKSSFFKKSRGLQILDYIYAKVSLRTGQNRFFFTEMGSCPHLLTLWFEGWLDSGSQVDLEVAYYACVDDGCLLSGKFE